MSEERRDYKQPDQAPGAMPELWRDRRETGSDLGGPAFSMAPRGNGNPVARSVDLPGSRPSKPSPLSQGFWWPMRGRWKWAGIASVIGVALGLVLGYGTSTLRYAADGRVELRPMQTGGPDRPAATADDVRGVVEREAVLLGESANAFVTEAMSFSVQPTPPTGLSVSVEAGAPDAARSALQQTLTTYDGQTTLHSEVATAEKADALLGQLDQLRATRDDLQRRIDALSWEDGVALVAVMENAQRESATLNERLERIGQWFDDSNRLKVSRDTALVVLAENDERTAELLIERAELLVDLIEALAQRKRGVAAELKERFLAMAEEIDAIAADTRVLPAAWVGAPQDERRLVAVRLSEIRTERASLQTQITSARKRVTELEAKHRRLVDLQEELRDARRRTQRAEESYAQLAERPAVVLKLVSTRVVDDALQTPVVDDRLSRSAIGVLLGALAGFIGVLVWAFADPRLRRADPEPWAQREAPLVGVVPDVNTTAQPTSDPKQAAAVQRDLSRLADAVHAIRAVVEAQLDGRTAQTICVTSATPGSGKTSLTIGLASSLVMGGLRVLVVDAALTDRKDETDEAASGSGLTKDLEPTGQTLEAALGAMGYLEPEDRDLLAFPDDQPVGLGAYLRGTPIQTAAIPTRVSGLALLGAAHVKAGDAGRLSRTFLERMSRDTAEHYDVVLFDTGTVPRCVEAVFVAGACRGVLLVVGRDEARRAVDAALQKLRMVGANLLGTVFNREVQSEKFREKYAAPPEGSPMLDPSWRNQGSGMFAAAVRTHGGQEGTVEEPKSQTGIYRGQAKSAGPSPADGTSNDDASAGPIDFTATAAEPIEESGPAEHPTDDPEEFAFDFDAAEDDTEAESSAVPPSPHDTAIDFAVPEPTDEPPNSDPVGSSHREPDPQAHAPLPQDKVESVEASQLPPSEPLGHTPESEPTTTADENARGDELIDQYIDSVLDAVGSESPARPRTGKPSDPPGSPDS
ncbi:MAG: hypothetical protein AAGH92_03805 [Planctomycetota bacterium]